MLKQRPRVPDDELKAVLRNQSRELPVEEWHNIAGRGRVATYDTRKAGDVKVGERVKMDGGFYEITSIERMGRQPVVGLVVKKRIPRCSSMHPKRPGVQCTCRTDDHVGRHVNGRYHWE